MQPTVVNYNNNTSHKKSFKHILNDSSKVFEVESCDPPDVSESAHVEDTFEWSLAIAKKRESSITAINMSFNMPAEGENISKKQKIQVKPMTGSKVDNNIVLNS